MDHVFEAYQGTWGASRIQSETRERVDWLMAHVKGTRVLDIGCSQGLLALLLAERAPVTVLGIDVLDKAIDFANQMASEKAADLKGNVEFRCMDFMQLPAPETDAERYDEVVIGQVLEHLSDPRAFVGHAAKFVAPNGQLIVTVPYGLWEHDEHDQTFYARDLLRTLNGVLPVTSLEMAGGRLAAIMEPAAKNILSEADAIDLEYAFFLNKERRYLQAFEDRRAVLQNMSWRMAKNLPGRVARLALGKLPGKVLDVVHPATLRRFAADRRSDLATFKPFYMQLEKTITAGPTFERAIALRKTLSFGSESQAVKKLRARQSLLDSGMSIAEKSAPSYAPDKTCIFHVMNASLPFANNAQTKHAHNCLDALKLANWTAEGVTRLGYPHDSSEHPMDGIGATEQVSGITYHRLVSQMQGIDKLALDDYILQYAGKLEALAKDRKPFALHATSNYVSGLACAQAAACLGIAFIYEVAHGTQLGTLAEQNNAESKLTAGLEKQALQSSDRVLCHSEDTKSLLVNVMGVAAEKIAVLSASDTTATSQISDIYRELGGQALA